jgi:hypothetical protein
MVERRWDRLGVLHCIKSIVPRRYLKPLSYFHGKFMEKETEFDSSAEVYTSCLDGVLHTFLKEKVGVAKEHLAGRVRSHAHLVAFLQLCHVEGKRADRAFGAFLHEEYDKRRDSQVDDSWLRRKYKQPHHARAGRGLPYSR